MMVATYTVKPGDTLTKNIPLSLFTDSSHSIEVHGPNGFYRAFTGRPSSRHSVEAGVVHEREGAQLTGNVLVRLKVKGEEPVNVSIHDNSYKSNTIARKIEPDSETSVVLNLKQSHGWYDFTVKLNTRATRPAMPDTWRPAVQASAIR